MRGLPVQTLPLRIAVHANQAFVEKLAHETDRLLLSPVETSLEISARVSQADVILVDAAGLGPSAIQDIAALQIDRPVLAVVKREQAKAALDAGADGVLLESASAVSIEAALQAVHTGLAALDPSLLSAVGTKRDENASTTPTADTAVHGGTSLTPRESEVIVHLADGLSNKQIAAKLGISEHTAKFHVNSILQKMHAQKRVEAVVRAAQLGILTIRPAA